MVIIELAKYIDAGECTYGDLACGVADWMRETNKGEVACIIIFLANEILLRQSMSQLKSSKRNDVL